MDVGGTVTIRYLQGGDSEEAVVLRKEGREIDLELRGQGAQDLAVGMLLEIRDPAAIYLGVLQRLVSTSSQPHITLHVEHYLDRKAVAEMQAAWSQVEPIT